MRVITTIPRDRNADPRFASRIDRARIGAAGLSIGGNSVLELAGARADLSALRTYCTQKPQTLVCSGEASRHPGLTQDAHALALSERCIATRWRRPGTHTAIRA